VSRHLAVVFVVVAANLATVAPVAVASDADTEGRACRDRSLAEMRSGLVPELPDPGRSGAVLEIALPATVVTVRSKGGHAHRRTSWFILYMPSHQAVEAAWSRMDAVRAAIAVGLEESSFEDMCTIARDNAVTLRLEQRVREVLGDDRVMLRLAIAGAERIE